VMLGASFSATRAATLPEVLPAGQLMAGTEISSIGSRAGQALGFLAGGAAVAVLRPGGLLMMAAVAFLAVAGIISWLASRHPAEQPRPHGRPLALPVTRAEAAAVMRQPLPRVLLLLGWLAGCAVVPEALAMPYAHVLHGGLAAAGLLMAAIPAGAVAGAAAITFLPRPSSRLRILAWLAAASCAPLAALSLHPALWAVLVLWVLAGAAGAYQLVAASALVRALPAGDRACAVDLAQSGLLAAQGTGLLTAGIAAQLIGPQAAIAVTGLAGLVAAARARAELAARLLVVEEVLGDGGGLALLGQDHPGGQVGKDADEPEERGHHEAQPYKVHVDVRVIRDARAHPRHHAPVKAADQPLAAVAVTHIRHHARFRGRGADSRAPPHTLSAGDEKGPADAAQHHSRRF